MTNYKNILTKVKKLVRKKLQNETSGHDYWHCYRVAKMALYIGKKEKANLKILELASWLHDIAIIEDKKNHEIRGSQLAKDFLIALNLDKKLINKVITCIKKHRFSKGLKSETLEEKILQDADKLDTLGAIGLARIFTLAGARKQIIHNPKIKPDFNYYLEHGKSNSTINHFYDKIFKLKGLMHTQTAKKIAGKREKYMKDYLRRFFLEWEGKK